MMATTSLGRISTRIAAVTLALSCAAILGGCGGGPKSAAQSYVDNLKLFNYPAVYQSVSHQDQIDRPIEQFLEGVPLAPDVSKEWFKTILTKTDFEIGEPKIDGDKAVVPVKVTAPDLAAWERTICATGSKAAPDDSAHQSLDSGNYPKITYDDDIALVKEGGDWKVFVDFPARDKVAKMHKDAVELYHKHDLDKAIAAYSDLLAELGKEQATGNDGYKFLYGREAKDVQNVKAQTADAQAYIPKLAMSEVDIKMAASQVPGLFGKISNTGDKPIDEVQMTVTYYTGKGAKKKALYTEDHTVVATPIAFTGFARPVLPLVPGETRDFGFKLSAPIDIQKKANPDLNVTAVIFTQSTAPLPKAPAPAASPAAAGSPAAASSPAPK